MIAQKKRSTSWHTRTSSRDSARDGMANEELERVAIVTQVTIRADDVSSARVLTARRMHRAAGEAAVGAGAVGVTRRLQKNIQPHSRAAA